VQVPKLLQLFPIGELLTQSEATIFGETEDIELLVVDELRHALFPKILLDVPQFLDREAGADLAEVVAEVHVVGRRQVVVVLIAVRVTVSPQSHSSATWAGHHS
jgi:hypothetical protein